MTTRRSLLLILAAAALLWAPTLLVAAPGDSFSYTLNWSRQFTAAFLGGDPYPRWTAASFDGLGAPTFYFYPPLPFWATALIGAATGGLLSAGLQAKLAVLAFLALSGFAMFAWLRTRAGALASLAGALVFMAAPYHLDDHYVRGAFAEFAAYALLPMLGLGLAACARGGRWGVPGLAAGWAALIACHLPTALLAGVLLVAPYGLFLIREASGGRIAAASRIGLAICAGTAIAALYLVPSLLLQSAVSSEYWWSDRFQAAQRVFANPAAWSLPLEPFLAALSFGEAALAGVIAWRLRRSGDRQALVWGVLVVAVFLVIAGLVPGFWSLPLMAKVQFPWRAMSLEEFALATLFAWCGPRARTPMVVIALAALVCGNAIAVARVLAAGPMAARAGYGERTFPTDADAPEYLPAGMLRMTADGPALAVPLGALTSRPLAAGPVLRAEADAAHGRVRLVVDPGRAGPIVLRRFYFPAWSVRCDGALVASSALPGARLVSFTPPPGARACEARIEPTPPERLGALVSLAGLTLVAAYALLTSRVGRRMRLGAGPRAPIATDPAAAARTG